MRWLCVLYARAAQQMHAYSHLSDSWVSPLSEVFSNVPAHHELSISLSKLLRLLYSENNDRESDDNAWLLNPQSKVKQKYRSKKRKKYLDSYNVPTNEIFFDNNLIVHLIKCFMENILMMSFKTLSKHLTLDTVWNYKFKCVN